jgi:hypothetical protein
VASFTNYTQKFVQTADEIALEMFFVGAVFVDEIKPKGSDDGTRVDQVREQLELIKKSHTIKRYPALERGMVNYLYVLQNSGICADCWL